MGFPSGGASLQVAATPLPGFPLQNATPNILAWTSPNDGKLHTVLAQGLVNITVAQTGGQLSLNYTLNGVAQSQTVNLGGNGIGISFLGAAVAGRNTIVCDPGTTVTLAQTTAQTAGAATLWASLLAT